MIVVASSGKNFFFIKFFGKEISVRRVLLFCNIKKLTISTWYKGRYEVSLCLCYLSAASGFLVYARDRARPSGQISKRGVSQGNQEELWDIL